MTERSSGCAGLLSDPDNPTESPDDWQSPPVTNEMEDSRDTADERQAVMNYDPSDDPETMDLSVKEEPLDFDDDYGSTAAKQDNSDSNSDSMSGSNHSLYGNFMDEKPEPETSGFGEIKSEHLIDVNEYRLGSADSLWNTGTGEPEAEAQEPEETFVKLDQSDSLDPQLQGGLRAKKKRGRQKKTATATATTTSETQRMSSSSPAKQQDIDHSGADYSRQTPASAQKDGYDRTLEHQNGSRSSQPKTPKLNHEYSNNVKDANSETAPSISIAKQPNICPVCDKTFIRPSELHRHTLIHTKEKPYKCTDCGQCFSQKGHLKSHIETHTGKKRHICPICGKSLNYLKRHMLIHTDEKNPNGCNLCGEVFTEYSTLLAHRRTHSDNKMPFTCDECGKSFLYSSHLREHAMSHTGDKPHLCDLCGKGFIRPSLLERHKLFHSGEKSHRCHECGKAFALKSHLKNHLFTHTEEKAHRCLICGKEFKMLDYLKIHLSVHNVEKSHKCPHCEMCFARQSYLVKHIKKKHTCDI